MTDKIIQHFKEFTVQELEELCEHLENEIRLREKSLGAAREVIQEKVVESTCYQHVRIRCGKKNCRCSRGELHGPYWYAYFREDGKNRCRYVGKTLPDNAAILKFSEGLRRKAEKARAISSQRAKSSELARLRARSALLSIRTDL